MKKRKVFQIGLAAILILLIFSSIDFSVFITTLLKVNLLFIGLAVFTYFLLNLSMAYRLQKSLWYVKKKISFKTSFGAQLFGMLCSDATPGRVGYVSLVYLLKKKTKVPITTSLAAIGICQAIEFIIKVALSIVSLIYILPLLEGKIIYWVGIGLTFLFFCGLGFLVFCWWKDISFLKKFFKKLPAGGKVYSFLHSMKEASRSLRRATLIIILLTALGWILRGIEWIFLGYAVGIVGISVFGYLILHPLITAIRFVPLTPAGIGMFEWIVIIFFAFFGIPSEKAFLFALLDRVDNIILDFFAIGEVRYV